MITLLSPAKTLDFDTPAKVETTSSLIFAEKAQVLAKKLSKWKVSDFQKYMDISPKLAALNAERYQNWSLPVDPQTGRPAMYAFKGDVYLGLQAEQFNKREVAFAQEHMRILSGLYGLLRPLDLILPYRLEMGTSWQVNAGNPNLYAFWKSSISKQLKSDMSSSGSNYVLNLASNEYAKAVDFKSLKSNVLSPEFKEERGDRFQMIGFFAKKARGLMAAYVVRNGINDFEGLKDFNEEGYTLNERLSNFAKNKWVFTRKTK